MFCPSGYVIILDWIPLWEHLASIECRKTMPMPTALSENIIGYKDYITRWGLQNTWTSILLPALGQAREKAKSSQCVGNLRQLRARERRRLVVREETRQPMRNGRRRAYRNPRAHKQDRERNGRDECGYAVGQLHCISQSTHMTALVRSPIGWLMIGFGPKRANTPPNVPLNE